MKREMIHGRSLIVIDVEFNDFRGEIISLGCVGSFGEPKEFYEVLHCQNPSPWVADNVIPVLHKPPVARSELAASLARYLAQFEQCHIVADWPEDIAHFCNSLIVGPGQRVATPPLTFELVSGYADTKDTSAIPHNALEDARALHYSIITGRRK